MFGPRDVAGVQPGGPLALPRIEPRVDPQGVAEQVQLVGSSREPVARVAELVKGMADHGQQFAGVQLLQLGGDRGVHDKDCMGRL